MDKDWILLKKETKHLFAKSTWIPLRANVENEDGEATHIGYTSNYFGCGSVAFPLALCNEAEKFGWNDIGIGCNTRSRTYEDGHYSPIEEYEYPEKTPMGIHLVFEHPQPVINKSIWMLNPDLVVALRLIKEGNSWVRPEENFIEVAREVFDNDGNHQKIEIKREFLIDYLAARNLNLRLSYYYQRVKNLNILKDSAYQDLSPKKNKINDGDFELRINPLDNIYGGEFALMRVWRTDVDEDEDVPVMQEENNDNTEYQSTQGKIQSYSGMRIEGEFWRDEWIKHKNHSIRTRGDEDTNLPTFIVDNDGTYMKSVDLNDEDIGRWLWFRPNIINELLGCRGFSLKWYTAQTGGIASTSGLTTHFGINNADLINVYACDVPRLDSWEQRIWAAHNIAPEGQVSAELLSSQMQAKRAETSAVEILLFEVMRLLEKGFMNKFKSSLFLHDINDIEKMQKISRFASKDQTSLLRLAKDIICVFSDRLNVKVLREISTHKDKKTFGSNKLLQDILAQEIAEEKARQVFSPIVGTYDMRTGDAHPTSSKIKDALNLAGIDTNSSFLKQGEQLISNFGQAIWLIGKSLFEETKSNEGTDN